MNIVIVSLQYLSEASFGLLSLADALMQKNHNVRLIGSFSDNPESYVKFFQVREMQKAFVDEIQSFEPDVIGISSMSQCAHHLPWITKFLKNKFPDIPLFFGGQHALVVKEKAFDSAPELDYCMYGEGEDYFPLFLEKLSNKDYNFESIKGLIYKDGEKVLINEMPEAVDINKFFPARGIKAISSVWDRYNASVAAARGLKKPAVADWHTPLKTPSFDMMLTRGCPYRCTFCKLHGVKTAEECIRHMSPEVFEEQLDYVIKEFNIKSLYIYDSSFDLNKKWAEKICKILKERKEIIDWFCQLRPNLVDQEFVELLVESGCRGVNLYAESGSEYVRNVSLRKNVSDDQMKRAFAITKELGLFRRCNIIIGIPGETLQDMKESFKAVLELEPDSLQALPLDSYPGTEITKKHIDEVIYKDVLVYDEANNSGSKVKGFTGYIKTEVPRKLVENIAQVMNVYGHFFSFLIRDNLDIYGKSLLIVEPDQRQEAFLVDYFRGVSPVQILSLGLYFQDMLVPDKCVTLLVGPNSKVVKKMIPDNFELLKLEMSPLELEQNSSLLYELKDKSLDMILIPYFKANEETLEKFIKIASYVSIKKVCFIDLYKGCLIEWDLYTKLSKTYSYYNNIEKLLLNLNENL